MRILKIVQNCWMRCERMSISNRDGKVHAKVSHKSVDLFIHKGRTKIEFCYSFFFANTCIRHNSILGTSCIQNFRFASIVVVVGFVGCLHISHFFSFIFCVDSVRRLPWLSYVVYHQYGSPFKLKSIWILSHYSFLAFNFWEMHLWKTRKRCAYELHCIIISWEKERDRTKERKRPSESCLSFNSLEKYFSFSFFVIVSSF